MKSYDSCRVQVLECCQWLSRHGFFGTLRGTGGNISMRTESGDTIVITPSSTPYDTMKTGDLCVMDLDGKVLEGELKPTIEAGLHCAVYRNRQDVNAVVHTHQLYASVLSVINAPIPALFDEVALSIGHTVDIIPYAFSGSQELAGNVEKCVGNMCNCFLIQNHGALSLGRKLEKAWQNAELLEKAAEVYYLALASGRDISTLPESSVELVKKLRG